MTRLLRLGAITAIVGFAFFCAVLLTLRFVVFPRVEDFRDTLTDMLSRELGAPVEIDRLLTGWDGWNPKLVIEGFRVRDRARIGMLPLLDLPEVDLIVAWTSLPFLDLRLKQLIVERPRLAVRRDAAGMIHIAGMELDPKEAKDSGALTDWVLRQPQILIRDALITWNDDQRSAPQLVLDQVQFRLESRFGRHRFGLHGTPPGELSAPIDLRGDVRGLAGHDWRAAAGMLYVRLDYADLAAWHEWLPFPAEIESGKGALRLWFEFAGGEATDAVADLELADVRARLGGTLPQLDLDHLSGRIGWKGKAPQREIYGRQLAFVAANGQALAPTDFALMLRDSVGDKAGSGQLDFEHLQLGPLRDLAVHLPLPERLRAELERYAPRGTLTHGRILWDGPPDDPTTYSASTDFAELGIVAQNAIPGVNRFTGHFEATQAGGRLKLATHSATIELPQVFAEPIALDALQGDVSWETKEQRTTVRIERLDFGNRDAAGTASGQIQATAQGPGEVDITAQLARADAARVYRYWPRMLDDAARAWLRTAFVKGKGDDVRLKLAGNLADFPFADGKSGHFSLTGKVHDGTLDYAKGWPSISGIDAEFRLEGSRLAVDALRGLVYEAPLGKLHAEIADLRAAHPVVRLTGDIAGPTTEFLRFIDNSPLAAWTHHVADGTSASGRGQLQFTLELPLGDPGANRITGEYQFIDNDIHFPGTPAMAELNGKLQFTEHDMHALDLSTEVLGGAAKLAVTSADGRVHVGGGGTATVAAIGKEFELPYTDLVTGSLDWTIASETSEQGSTWVMTSNMKGLGVDLPAPLGKTAATTVALRVERRAPAAQPNDDHLTVDYAGLGRLLMDRKLTATGATADRALLLLGRAAEKPGDVAPDRPGLWVRGELPALNIDDWLVVRGRAKLGGSDNPGSPLELAGTDIDIGVLDAFGRKFHEMKVAARRVKDDWKLDLAGRELAGTATWAAPTAAAPNGRIAARLARFTPPDAGTPATWKGGASSERAKPDAAVGNPWPEIDIAADKYLVHGRDIGSLEVDAHPSGTDWRIDKLTLANDAGRLSADGWWRVAGRRQQTKLDVVLDVKDVGAYLARLGHADAIRSGPTKINGQLEWAGAPSDFDYPTLGGAFRVEVGPGRFIKVEPGMGKLLGVLSLQSLPKRITLDFTDVFSEGFAFDEIVGDVTIENGVMRTRNLKLNGPAAKVDISGEADIAKETQQLVVRVQPTLSAGVSAGAALLFLANPIIGAAVGAGSLLAQKVLRDPIEQMFSYEYAVTGSWSDPIVARRGREKPAPLADAPTR